MAAGGALHTRRGVCLRGAVPLPSPPRSSQAYTGLRTLYLQQNAISEVEGLEALTQLRTLVLAKNLLGPRVGPGLHTLALLEALDLSDNMIEHVDGLDALPRLKTLVLSGNRMRAVADVAHLAGCPALTSLDLSSCRLQEEGVVDLVTSWSGLAYLRLQGNPVVSSYACVLHVGCALAAHHVLPFPATPSSPSLVTHTQRAGTTARRSWRACPSSTTWTTRPPSQRTSAWRAPLRREASRPSAGESAPLRGQGGWRGGVAGTATSSTSCCCCACGVAQGARGDPPGGGGAAGGAPPRL